MKKYCVYTCISGSYDPLYDMECYDDRFDYLCFTDIQDLLNKKIINKWKILPIEQTYANSTLNNRYQKIQGYKQLKEYQASIYIDANVVILTPYIYDNVLESGHKMLFPIHSKKDCIYSEIYWAGIAKKDKPKSLALIYDELIKNGMPKHYGLTENNMIFRIHGCDDVDKIMDEWWYYVNNYTKRDQLSLSYVLWKHDIEIKNIATSNVMYDYTNFRICPHLTTQHLRPWNIKKFHVTNKLYNSVNPLKVYIYTLIGGFLAIPQFIKIRYLESKYDGYKVSSLKKHS